MLVSSFSPAAFDKKAEAEMIKITFYHKIQAVHLLLPSVV